LILKGVLIDFGDTLAYLDKIKERKYEAELVSELRKYGYERSLEALSAVLSSIYVNNTKGELKTPQEFWNLALKKLKIPERLELIDSLQLIRSSHEATMWKLYDGVSETLAMLREKYRLALVSNCAVGTDRLIRSLGLADFFVCIILSYQVGARKPDKRMYLEALGCLELEAKDCIFIADEISDLEGAKEIGLKTVLVGQDLTGLQNAKDASFKPDFQISRISEVTKIL
jgi:HAD superfamily hydrolase (TIGR01509 family)